MLVHVAIMLVGLLAFSALAVDYGVLWTSRRQAQNAADAAALSAATSLAFRDPADTDAAKLAGVVAGQANPVWGSAPTITPDDIPIGACPPGAPGLPDKCVRANVFRNQARGSALPTFFARLLGINEQGVRATATAQVAVGRMARCVRPWAIPDRWWDVVDTPQDGIWTWDDDYERRDKFGNMLPPTARDAYFAPGEDDPDGLTRTYPGFNPIEDRGQLVALKIGNPQQTINAGWFFPVALPREGEPDTGGDRYRNNIVSCNSLPVTTGFPIQNEPGGMIGPTKQGIDELIAMDPDATWSEACQCVVNSAFGASPRIVPVAVFSPEEYDTQDRSSGRFTVRVVKVLGMFVLPMQGNDVMARVLPYPADVSGGLGPQDESSFLRTVILVR